MLKYKIWFLLKKQRLKQKSVILGHGVRINKKTCFEGNNRIHNSVTLSSSNIGIATYIGDNCYMVKCKIGRFCSIGSNVRIVRGNHPAKLFVSTHPAFFSLRKQAGFTFVDRNKFDEIEYANDSKDFCEIGNDVWIGNNVLIKQGVTIHDGAVIGMGSVLLHDVEPYAIYGGVPAKKIGYRFNENQINRLMEIQWWGQEISWIKRASDYFNDIDMFIKKVDNNEL